jgi:hypothetical protein
MFSLFCWLGAAFAVGANQTLDGSRASVKDQLKTFPKNAKYYSQAQEMYKLFDNIRLGVNPNALDDATFLQEEIAGMRQIPRFAQYEDRWIRWSVAHDQASLIDRLNRMYSIYRGRPHSLNKKNFAMSAFLLSEALLYTLKSKEGEFVIDRISNSLCQVLEEIDNQHHLRPVLNILNGYSQPDYSSVINAILCSCIVLSIYLVFIYITQPKIKES